MRIAAYAETIRSTILNARYLVSHALAYEDRPPIAGVVKGHVAFSDGSRLYFKEFVRFGEEIQRLKYSYHYVAPSGTLVFRYDNALDPAAKAVASYPDHKHLPGEIVASDQPTFEQVLVEVGKHVKHP